MKKVFFTSLIIFSIIATKNANLFDYYKYDKKYYLKEITFHLFPLYPSISAKSYLVGEISSGKVLMAKNENEPLPIASITKIVSALTLLNSNQNLNEVLEIKEEDKDTLKGSTSYIPTGTSFTRGELLNLALMSSENRAMLCLARNYKGSLYFFVRDMNRLVNTLSLKNSYFVDPCGLSPFNISTAIDLFEIGRNGYLNDTIRDFTTRDDLLFTAKNNHFRRYFGNTNDLVVNKNWNIKMSKTGYILEAGRCLLLAFEVKGVDYLLILLNEPSIYHRDQDAERIKMWLEEVVK